MTWEPTSDADDTLANTELLRQRGLAPVISLLDQARRAVSEASAPRPEQEVEPPNRLGDFDLLTPIGRGGMGVVYEARQRSLDRIVAIKVLPRSILPTLDDETQVIPESQQNLIHRFHTEARAAARLHHPNIVPVFGFGEAAGYYYFAMQRIDGQGLDRWINRYSASESPDRMTGRKLAHAVAEFGLQAAQGLVYAHQEGVLHRDIKPANLLIDSEGKLRIADFGVARIDDSEALTQTSDVVGTLRYMSPEQIAGDATAQSDVYSLGVTLYEMATGTPAVDDASLRQALLAQKSCRGPAPLSQAAPDFPRDLRTVIEKAMATEADRRYHSAAALAEDLQRYLSGRPILARRMPVWERSFRWVRRNRTVSALASLLIFTLSITAANAVVSNQRISRALDETQLAKRSAERSATLATGAIEKMFGRFASSTDSTNITYESVDYSAPAVDRGTVALLEEMIVYYDDIIAESNRKADASATTDRDRIEARLHLGKIHQQLGNLEAAVSAYEQTLDELKTGTPLLRARVHNQIGIVYEVIGRRDQAKPHHARAVELLTPISDSDGRPEVRFELARSQLLLARRLRPGMGPESLPPMRAFHFDPWKPLHGQGDQRPPHDRSAPGHLAARYPEHPSRDFALWDKEHPPWEGGAHERPRHDRGRGGGPPPRRPVALPEHHPDTVRRPLAAFHTDRRQFGATQRHRFADATAQLIQLRGEHPDSVPVALLLSHVVRQSLGDALHSHHDPAMSDLADLAQQLRRDFHDMILSNQWQGNDAAIAYELVLLLADFNVFRDLTDDEVRLGIEWLDLALPIVEKLVQDYPNVSEYESLAAHTAFKAASLQSLVVGRDPRSGPEAVREVRSLLRQAFKYESRLRAHTPSSDGYSLWCALFLMRVGDLQKRIDDGVSGAKSYRRALRFIPIESLAAELSGTVSVPAGPHRDPNQSEKLTIGATLCLLDRLARDASHEDPELAGNAEELIQELLLCGPITADDLAARFADALEY